MPCLKIENMKNLSVNLKHPIIEERDSSFNDEMLKNIEAMNHLNNQSQKILKITACDFCMYRGEIMCFDRQNRANKNLCDKIRLFNTGKRIANERALALYEQELRRFKRILNVVSKDGTGSELISVRDSLADFEKALKDDK